MSANRTIAENTLGDKISRYAPFRDQLLPHQTALLEQVEKHGYCILPRVFSPQQVAETKRVVAELEAAQAGPASGGGRNLFEGYQTKRVYGIFAKSRDFDKYATHPDVLALNRVLLGGGNLVSAAHSICIDPGQTPQVLHFDDGMYPMPRPRASVSAAIMVSLDPYTENNGATVAVPDSHLWGPERSPEDDEASPVVMPAGSILYFVGQLWHGGGRNTSTAPRNALTIQYCAGYLRPMENQFLAVSPEILRTIDNKPLLDMLGYSVYPPFLGYGEANFILRSSCEL
ncbi:hypothetical protein RQP46_001905 [Phenoliferia psychrophenolica]